MDVFLIRHPAVEVDNGVCYGHLDVPLKEPVDAALRPITERLLACSGEHPQIVWTSPLGRCHRLGQALADKYGVALKVDPRWSELHFGEWEGRRWEDIDRAQSDPWASNPWDIAPPGGETYRALHRRVREALGALAVRRAPCLAVITHAGPIRTAVGQILGISKLKYPALGLAPGGLTWLHWARQRWTVEAMNR